MARPKKNEPGHEMATRRWRKTMEELYGGKEGLHRRMQEMGAMGGRAGCTGGFHGHSERAKLAGKRGGQNSKRGCEYLGEKDGVKRWVRKSTGELIEETV